MKYTTLLALIASTQAMDSVPIASLIELNEEPVISGSGLPEARKICTSWTDEKGVSGNCIEPEDLKVGSSFIQLQDDDDKKEVQEAKLEPLDSITRIPAKSLENKICNGLNNHTPCHEVDEWSKIHSYDKEPEKLDTKGK